MIKIFADGADLKTMAALSKRCDGATTNPTLLKKARITNYKRFAREVCRIWGGKPVSFEVLADDPAGMVRQAEEIVGWGGSNVFVKIPVINARGQANTVVLQKLSQAGIKLNVTAILSLQQTRVAVASLSGVGHIISVFAGRIADTGRNAAAAMAECRLAIGKRNHLLWASARQVYSVVEAEKCGADIITLTPDLIHKLDGFGRDLEEYSKETVKQFVKDARGIAF